jgi:uncharacterized repeat protein (TIGR03809 family)
LPNRGAAVNIKNADSAGAFGFINMSEREQGRYGSVARRWLALVERRQEHLIELCDTGRWRHYYTKAEFLDEMRRVLRVRDQWAGIAGLPPHDEEPEFLGRMQTPHRLLPDRLVPLSLAADAVLGGEADLPPVAARANGLPVAGWPD